MGLGLCFGPLIGAIVSNYFTFSTTMVIFALIVLIVGTYGVNMLDNELDNSMKREE